MKKFVNFSAIEELAKERLKNVDLLKLSNQ